AGFAPVLRVRRAGGGALDLASVAAATALGFGFVSLGADARVVVLLVGVFGADVVVRSIRLRRRAQRAQLLDRTHGALVLPLVAAWFWPAAASAWAALAVACACTLYTWRLLAGLRESAALVRPSEVG